MSSPKAPRQPDVVAAAREQGQQNIEAARVTAGLNRINQVGPGGTVTYTQDPNNKDQYTQTTQLSDEQQRLYNQQTSNDTQRATLGGANLGMYGGLVGRDLNFSGLPQRVTSVGTSDQVSSINAPSSMYGRIRTGNLPGFEQQPGRRYQEAVDFSRATPLAGNEDFTGERQRVEDALYGRSARRLDDQFARREEDLRSQLLNRGLREGTAAYADAMRDLNEARTDAYGDLRDRAVLAGGQEQQRLFDQTLRARQQGVGETLQQGQFANDATQAENLYGLNRRQQAASERGQVFGENTTQAQFGNQSADQRFRNELARGQFQNDAQSQEFQQRIAEAMLNNQGRDAGIGEQERNQQQIMQGLSFLLGGGGAQMPQSFAPGSSGGIEPADIYGATQDAYTNQLGVYNQRAQAAQQQQQAAAKLASLAIFGLASDRRLKTDIKQEGKTPSGLGIYSFRYKWGGDRYLGTMADEVREVYPDAVVRHESGYDVVDYGKVTAREMETI